MDYFDILRRNGWLADPGERVRVVAVHQEGCLADRDRPCSCEPKLLLAADGSPRETRLADKDLPTLDLASGE